MLNNRSKIWRWSLNKKSVYTFLNTAWKVSVLGVILIRIFPHSDWIREILRISSYSVWMRESADQNNSGYGHFLRSVKFWRMHTCSWRTNTRVRICSCPVYDRLILEESLPKTCMSLPTENTLLKVFARSLKTLL